jgi:hypothetical protein
VVMMVTPVALVSAMFHGCPFSEPIVFRMASAYVSAHHRIPPHDCGPVR